MRWTLLLVLVPAGDEKTVELPVGSISSAVSLEPEEIALASEELCARYAVPCLEAMIHKAEEFSPTPGSRLH